MKAQDKLNLRRAHSNGKFFNSRGEITLASIRKAAKKIPFLSPYFNHTNPEAQLDDLAALEILKNITSDDGQRIYYLQEGDYVPFEEKFGSREAYNLNQFFFAVERALRLSPSQEVSEVLREVIDLANEAKPQEEEPHN